MGNYFGILAAGAVAFLAIVILLAKKPNLAMRTAAVCAVIAALGGLLFYGYGFVSLQGLTPLAIIRTLFSVCCMFIGEVDFDAISDAALFGQEWAVSLFWVVQLLAFFATATAAVSAVGSEALRRLRVWLARWGDLHLIYGANDNSLELGRSLTDSGCMVVFLDDAPDLSEPAEIAAIGCILRTDKHAIGADKRFLKQLGIRKGSRIVNLYTMKTDPAENIAYARRFLQSLETRNVASSQTRLVIHAHENSTAGSLQATSDRYGYGFVSIFQESALAARLLMHMYPPCDSIRFGEDGRAAEDFEAIVVGFGHLGQAVLRQLTMNGQFAGSTFRAAVFSPDCLAVNGSFTNSFRQVIENYDISFHPYDARSSQMYEHLTRRKDKLRYIVICTGSPTVNQEIAEEIASFFRDMGICVPVYQCSYRGVTAFDADMENNCTHPLYDPELLSMRQLDARAMVINHYYQGQAGGDALANWMKCDYFSRMSCRASADFMPAMLRAAGKTEEQVLAGDWQLPETVLWNLSETEHLRWCAFHYCMGFSPMSPEEYDAREAEYLRQKAAGRKPDIRWVKTWPDGLMPVW